MKLTAVILAAGQGTRMKSDLPKVLHRAAGRTLLDWALGAVMPLHPQRCLAVVGHGAEAVRSALPDGVEAVVQEPQLGTGHATEVALQHVGQVGEEDLVLVTYGDMPLVTPDIYRRVLSSAASSVAVMVSTRLEDPSGYGRVVRDAGGGLERVVEDRDASPEEAAVQEVNAGIYAFRGDLLYEALRQVTHDNAQAEHYLPDVLSTLKGQGHGIVVIETEPESVLGVNSHDQLAEAESVLRKRINRHWQQQGVWMQDPTRVYLDAEVMLEAGVRLYPGVHLEGDTRIGTEAVIGPDTYLLDSVVGPRARVWYSVVRKSEIGAEAEVGPFASLRPGTILDTRSKAGTFVEMKNAQVGEGAKVPHLAYMGDATIGPGANVGAGSITCNYDGYEKHRTVIGEDAFIGSDTMLVAPVSIGKRAVTGAGSVITRDVEDGALAVERSMQKVVPGYADRREERHHPNEAQE